MSLVLLWNLKANRQMHMETVEKQAGHEVAQLGCGPLDRIRGPQQGRGTFIGLLNR